MAGDAREPSKKKEQEARDLEDVAEVEGELAGRPDLAVAARGVAQELRDEIAYLTKKEEENDADSGC